MRLLNGGYFLALATASILLATAGAGEAPAQTATNLQCNGCVGASDLGKNAVRKKHIAKKAVNASRLAGSAKPAGVDFVYDQSEVLLTTVKDVASVEINAPSAGYVVASASSYVLFTGTTYAYCAIAAGAIPPVPHYVAAKGTPTLDTFPLAQTRVFPVPAGKTTFFWKCYALSASDAYVWESDLSVLFVPVRY